MVLAKELPLALVNTCYRIHQLAILQQVYLYHLGEYLKLKHKTQRDFANTSQIQYKLKYKPSEDKRTQPIHYKASPFRLIQSNVIKASYNPEQ